MARRKSAPAPTADLILPRELIENREAWRTRQAWLREQGADPHDWDTVRAILRASREAYGLPLEPAALTRARKRFAEQVKAK